MLLLKNNAMFDQDYSMKFTSIGFTNTPNFRFLILVNIVSNLVREIPSKNLCLSPEVINECFESNSADDTHLRHIPDLNCNEFLSSTF